MAFNSDRRGPPDFYEKSTRGQAAEKLIFHSDENKFATSWSRDGRYIAFTSQSPKTNLDVWALPTFGDRKPIPISNGPFAESIAMFSPDGRHVAYVSNESGRGEIYVQTFPEAGGRCAGNPAKATNRAGRATRRRWHRGAGGTVPAAAVRGGGG